VTTHETTSVFSRTVLDQAQVRWIYQLVGEGQLLADLAFADIVVWAPTPADGFVAVSHLRPSSAATLFYRDVVGSEIRPEWAPLVREAFTTEAIVDSKLSETLDSTPTKVRAVPIRMATRSSEEGPGPVIAVMTRHTNLSESRIPSRQELTFNQCANDLLLMISEGFFPDPETPSAPTHGAPRASDGLIRLDRDGRVTFASPNALSAFRRMGCDDELEGTLLAEVTAQMLQGTPVVDESLPLVLTGRAPWRTDVEAEGVTVTLRAIPLKQAGERFGAVVLSRDVTQVRLREREMITKDATIREIHHRVKNNLQTVASLLRIQSRRTQSEMAKDALSQAMRRVAAIAVVHDTLSEGLSQNVDFDVVFERVLQLVAEVASGTHQVVKPRSEGSFGVLPSEYATPLALVLTELVTNAVEHGLAGKVNGEVVISANRTPEKLSVTVRDNGGGLPEGKVGEGLGTQIVRTLVQGELGGSIDWHTLEEEGTEVTIDIPLQYLHEKDVLAVVPSS
jgi:two-component system, sensor histidine kinase PdtaS